MPLGEFTQKYGGDVNALLMDNINQRLQATKVTCLIQQQCSACCEAIADDAASARCPLRMAPPSDICSRGGNTESLLQGDVLTI